MAKLDKKVVITTVKAEIEYWQKTLRLEDWTIDIRLLHPEDQFIDNHWGQCITDAKTKASLIKLAHPLSKKVGWERFVHTLIHELLHIHLDAWDTETELETVQQETAINLTAGALLITSKRGGKAPWEKPNAKPKRKVRRRRVRTPSPPRVSVSTEPPSDGGQVN